MGIESHSFTRKKKINHYFFTAPILAMQLTIRIIKILHTVLLNAQMS